MNLRSLVFLIVLVVTLGLAGPTRAQNVFNFYLYQDGSNVVATGSGIIDLTDLTYAASNPSDSAIFPIAADILVGPDTEPSVSLYEGLTGPASFGPGFTTNSTSGTGDSAGVSGSSTDGLVDVPEGYTSGSFLSGTATWNDATLSSLGVTSGTYTWTYGSGVDAGTINFYAGVSPVPEPSQYGLLVFLAATGFIVWRRFTARAAVRV